jgi:transcriptional regulator with XRE-family HTH domain
MKINSLMPEQMILQELGQRLARVRKQQGFSQTRLAQEAGIGVATLRRIEAGQDSQMETWLKLMKTLRRVGAVEAWLPESFDSPMQEVLKNRKRKARHETDGEVIKWGDEHE